MSGVVSASLLRVLKEFGVVGVVTYIGGLILLSGFIWEKDFQRQILLGVVGVILLSLSIFIAYFRLKIQKDREKALIEMEGGTCNRLAEQLGKDLSDKQTFAIIQKIRQTQNDLLKAIIDNTEALFTTRLFLRTVKSIKDWSFQPLQDAIVIAYARPFTRNKPYGPLDKKWEMIDDPGLQRLHELILQTRHTLIAHSDNKYRKVQIIPPGTSAIPGIPTNKDLALTVSTKKISMDMFPRIEALCLYVGGNLDKEMFDLLDKLYGGKKLSTEPFDLV